jgi:hypothetical protein
MQEGYCGDGKVNDLGEECDNGTRNGSHGNDCDSNCKLVDSVWCCVAYGEVCSTQPSEADYCFIKSIDKFSCDSTCLSKVYCVLGGDYSSPSCVLMLGSQCASGIAFSSLQECQHSIGTPA